MSTHTTGIAQWGLWLVSLLALAVPTNAGLYYPDFSTADGLTLVGNASLAGGVLELTPALVDQRGAAWSGARQRVVDGFETTFTFRMSEMGGSLDDGGQTGADGIAFVIQNSGPAVIGGLGRSMGYAGLANSLAIEHDTFWNLADPANGDPNGNHVSVQTCGENPNSDDHLYSIGSTTAIPYLSDEVVHTTRIQYEPGTLRIFIDDLSVPAMTVTVDLSETLNLPDGQAWVGVTAATRKAYQQHEILSWVFVPEPSAFALLLLGGLFARRQKRASEKTR